MISGKPRHLTLWYCLLCTAQVIVLGTVVFTLLSANGFDLHSIEDLDPAYEMVPVVIFGSAWLFLLIGSPFFFRSFRFVAWAGWILAVVVFLFGALVPIS